ncbi:hypothetical protein SAMN02745830_06524 [Streptomyces sp. Amel2xC10]|nr:hypothetical protein SAMN02745830_06524 [Streptomyces sp. Amel2xC10]
MRPGGGGSRRGHLALSQDVSPTGAAPGIPPGLKAHLARRAPSGSSTGHCTGPRQNRVALRALAAELAQPPRAGPAVDHLPHQRLAAARRHPVLPHGSSPQAPVPPRIAASRGHVPPPGGPTPSEPTGRCQSPWQGTRLPSAESTPGRRAGPRCRDSASHHSAARRPSPAGHTAARPRATSRSHPGCRTSPRRRDGVSRTASRPLTPARGTADGTRRPPSGSHLRSACGPRRERISAPRARVGHAAASSRDRRRPHSRRRSAPRLTRQPAPVLT